MRFLDFANMVFSIVVNVDTINTNAYKNRKNPSLVATSIQRGVNPNIPFIYGDKYVNC